MNFNKSLAMAGAVMLVGAANAQVNHFFWSDGSIPGSTVHNTDNSIKSSNMNHSGGKIKAMIATDNDTNNTFTWSSHLGNTTSGKQTKGFWLVVSDGPNPKGTSGQLAAFFFDNSTANAPKLSVYGYNGVNGATSYIDGSSSSGTQTPSRIKSSVSSPSWLKSITAKNDGYGNQMLGFSVDKKVINDYSSSSKWEGIDFSSNIGIWFHPVTDLSTSYDANGFLSKFQYGGEGWADISCGNTKGGHPPVPEPASMAALGLGIAGLIRRKRKANA